MSRDGTPVGGLFKVAEERSPLAHDRSCRNWHQNHLPAASYLISPGHRGMMERKQPPLQENLSSLDRLSWKKHKTSTRGNEFMETRHLRTGGGHPESSKRRD